MLPRMEPAIVVQRSSGAPGGYSKHLRIPCMSKLTVVFDGSCTEQDGVNWVKCSRARAAMEGNRGFRYRGESSIEEDAIPVLIIRGAALHPPVRNSWEEEKKKKEKKNGSESKRRQGRPFGLS